MKSYDTCVLCVVEFNNNGNRCIRDGFKAIRSNWGRSIHENELFNDGTKHELGLKIQFVPHSKLVPYGSKNEFANACTYVM